jgi:anthranilate phosphoribosyltransferase
MRRESLAKAVSGEHLTFEEALEVGRGLASGRTESLQTAAFLGALAARGETAEEVAGLAAAFREAVAPMRSFPDAVDTCGTGGDGRHTFNLSTAAALVAASLGVTVAKHGNRSISSACGSADLLERAGVPVDGTPREAEARLEQLGFAFLFAPRFHPAMAHVALVRRALGVRTVFNLLGPLLNPAGVRRQIVGVFDPDRAALVADSLSALGVERALVIHGEGGYDEAVLHGPVRVIQVEGASRSDFQLGPADFGLPEGQPGDLAGGTPEENVRTLTELFEGRGPSGLSHAVAANTALALFAAGVEENLREGSRMALEAMAGGRASKLLRLLKSDDLGEGRAQVS